MCEIGTTRGRGCASSTWAVLRQKGLGAAWAGSYLDQLLTRDLAAIAIGEERDDVRVRRYLQALAGNLAGVVSDATLIDAADVNRRTAAAYERVLEELFVIDRAASWWSNRLKRLTKMPKRYLVDGSLAAVLLGMGASDVLDDGDVLGRMLDNFVAAQVRAQLVTPEDGRLFHLRQQQRRHEVDLIVERGQRLIAMEVKATASPTEEDARHLAWLGEELGDRLVASVLFHTGPAAFRMSEGVHALPIAALWEACTAG